MRLPCPIRSRSLARPLLAAGLMVLAAHSASSEPPEQQKRLLDLAETRDCTLGRPVKATPTPEGSAVLFLRSGPRDPVLHLYELAVGTGQVREVLDPGALLHGTEENLSVEERTRRERMRVSLRGFTSFQLSEDGIQVLVSLSGRLWVLRRSDGKLTSLPGREWID